jgi:threonine aldolase
VNEDELDCTAARFVTAWNTEPNDIEQLLAVIGREYSNP